MNCQLMSAGMEMIIQLNRAAYLYNVGDGYFDLLVLYTINKIILFLMKAYLLYFLFCLKAGQFHCSVGQVYRNLLIHT